MLRDEWEGTALVQRRLACIRSISDVLGAIARRVQPDVWIVSDRHGIRPLVESDGHVLQPLSPQHGVLFRAALRRTLAKLTAHGAQVLILAAPPTAVPAACAGDPGADTCKSSDNSASDPFTGHLNRDYRAVARELPRVTVVSITDVLCPRGGICPILLHGRVPRWDGVHFTSWFSRRIVPVIVARAERAGVHFRVRPRRLLAQVGG
jgi:hypothetical protein